MPSEPLYIIVRNRIIDEPAADEQRDLLKALVAACFVKPTPTPPPGSERLLANLDFADRLFTEGRLLPRAYCYLAFCLKSLELSAASRRDWSQTARLWGYVFWSIMGPEERAGFTKAMQKDIEHLRTKHGRVPAAMENMAPAEDTPEEHPLKAVASSMTRALIADDDRDGLRVLIRWAYSAYEPHLRRLLDDSLGIEQWLTNVAELLPRLLLKNLIPLYDALIIRDPQIVIAERRRGATPPALHDPGVATRPTSLTRTLFSDAEIKGLGQSAQRISELFANVYPLLLIEDPERELNELRARIVADAAGVGRLQAKLHLETYHRHKMRLPTWLYSELKAELAGSSSPT